MSFADLSPFLLYTILENFITNRSRLSLIEFKFQILTVLSAPPEIIFSLSTLKSIFQTESPHLKTLIYLSKKISTILIFPSSKEKQILELLITQILWTEELHFNLLIICPLR